MSSERSRKSDATTWTLSILAVPVIYLLSTPAITFAVVQPVWNENDGAWRYRPGHGYPDWLKTYVGPFDWLRFNTPLGPPLQSYRDWCWSFAR
jgi:hypothetical protein